MKEIEINKKNLNMLIKASKKLKRLTEDEEYKKKQLTKIKDFGSSKTSFELNEGK